MDLESQSDNDSAKMYNENNRQNNTCQNYIYLNNDKIM